MFNVGARDVDFDGIHLVKRGELLAHRHVVIDRRPRDIDNQLAVIILDMRVDVTDEMVDTLVLQAYGIEHTRRRFGHAWIGIAFTRIEGGALYDISSETVEVDEVSKLSPIAKCPRRCEDGIF